MSYSSWHYRRKLDLVRVLLTILTLIMTQPVLAKRHVSYNFLACSGINLKQIKGYGECPRDSSVLLASRHPA
eukprot:6178259-Amphidinium_carterae.1